MPHRACDLHPQCENGLILEVATSLVCMKLPLILWERIKAAFGAILAHLR